jgi:hypothetical protein
MLQAFDSAAAAQRFASAAPFRHVVIDDFFAVDALQRIVAEFPPFERGSARNEAGLLGRKSVVERLPSLGGVYAELDRLIQSDNFLALISSVTGIPDLRYDAYYFGGGTHENLAGQELDPHIDFNRHPVTGWHRRLNLIVYLNEVWLPEWGGALDLHRDPRGADEVVSILPLRNRCVIFETTEHSWHGFRPIVAPSHQPDLSRRSIALYFYTVDRPEAELADPHSTVYVDRPLPDHFRAGYRLTDDDERTLAIAIARRDQHIQRLYADAQRLQTQLDAWQARWGATRLVRWKRALGAWWRSRG